MIQIVEIPSIKSGIFPTGSFIRKTSIQGFGDEFPIRFDFSGHYGRRQSQPTGTPPKRVYQEKFGMSYTQDENYYILDAGEDSFVPWIKKY